MTMVLREALQRYGLSQAEWASAVIQAHGRPLSRAAATQILVRNRWPKTTPVESIKEQTLAWLRTRGVPEADLARIWDTRPGSRNTTSTHETEIREMLHTATKKHFNLFRDPFQNDVLSSEDVFLPINYREIREAMLWAARNGSMIAVIGESGAGKSVLLRDVIERVDVADDGNPIRMIQPHVIDKTKLSSSDITEAVIYDLMPDARLKRSLEAKERQARELLKDSHKAGTRHVLVIEEAHDLSIRTLKLLKRYWEIVEGHRHLLGIILIGQPELKTKLDAYRYEARELINRLEIATLEPLGRDLEGYVELKLKRIGKTAADILEDDACEALRAKLLREIGREKVSMLYPLRVNVDLTRAMNKAAALGIPKVSGDVIRTL